MIRRANRRHGLAALQAVLLLGAGFLVMFGLMEVWNEVSEPVGGSTKKILNGELRNGTFATVPAGQGTGMGSGTGTNGRRPVKIDRDGSIDGPSLGSRSEGKLTPPPMVPPKPKPTPTPPPPPTEKTDGLTLTDILNKVPGVAADASGAIIDQKLSKELRDSLEELVTHLDEKGVWEALGGLDDQGLAVAKAQAREAVEKIAKRIGIIGNVIDLTDMVMEMGKAKSNREIIQASTGAFGGIVGGDLGAAAGATLGVVGGPVGIAVGAVIGATIGSAIGGWLGKEAGGLGYDLFPSW